MKYLISIILLNLFSNGAFATELITSTKSDSNFRVKEFNQLVPNNEEFYMKTLYKLPKGTVLKVSDSDRIESVFYGESIETIRRARAPYLGPVTLLEVPGYSPEQVALMNQVDLFIYRFSVDLAPFLKLKWDQDLPSGVTKTETNAEWDKISSKGLWTWLVIDALEKNGKTLLKKTPKDVVNFCPNYFSLNKKDQKIFWVHLFSSIAKRESAFDPDNKNDESILQPDLKAISRGLLQISYSSAKNRNYRKNGCQFNENLELHRPDVNLTCGVAIFEHLSKDGCISCKKGNKWKGVARYWSTLRTPYQISCPNCSTGVVNIGKKAEIIEEIEKLYRPCFL